MGIGTTANGSEMTGNMRRVFLLALCAAACFGMRNEDARADSSSASDAIQVNPGVGDFSGFTIDGLTPNTDEVDWFTFRVSESGSLSLNIDNTKYGAGTIAVHLRDSSNNTVMTGRTVNSGDDEYLHNAIDLSAGQYYLVISYHSGATQEFNYKFSLKFDAASDNEPVETNEPPRVQRRSPSSSRPDISRGANTTFEVYCVDDDDNLAKIVWTVNGSNRDSKTLSGGSKTSSFSTSFDQAGSYTVTATVYDSNDASDSLSWNVSVEAPPSNAPSISRKDPEDSSVQIDAGGQMLFIARCTDEDADLYQVEWKVGGVREGFNRVSGGSYTDSKTILFEEPGSFTVTATVFDMAGQSSKLEWSVSVMEPQAVQPDVFDIRADILLNKSEYAPGDQMVVDMEISGTGTVTVFAGCVLSRNGRTESVFYVADTNRFHEAAGARTAPLEGMERLEMGDTPVRKRLFSITVPDLDRSYDLSWAVVVMDANGSGAQADDWESWTLLDSISDERVATSSDVDASLAVTRNGEALFFNINVESDTLPGKAFDTYLALVQDDVLYFLTDSTLSEFSWSSAPTPWLSSAAGGGLGETRRLLKVPEAFHEAFTAYLVVTPTGAGVQDQSTWIAAKIAAIEAISISGDTLESRPVISKTLPEESPNEDGDMFNYPDIYTNFDFKEHGPLKVEIDYNGEADEVLLLVQIETVLADALRDKYVDVVTGGISGAAEAANAAGVIDGVPGNDPIHDIVDEYMPAFTNYTTKIYAKKNWLGTWIAEMPLDNLEFASGVGAMQWKKIRFKAVAKRGNRVAVSNGTGEVTIDAKIGDLLSHDRGKIRTYLDKLIELMPQALDDNIPGREEPVLYSFSPHVIDSPSFTMDFGIDSPSWNDYSYGYSYGAGTNIKVGVFPPARDLEALWGGQQQCVNVTNVSDDIYTIRDHALFIPQPETPGTYWVGLRVYKNDILIVSEDEVYLSGDDTRNYSLSDLPEKAREDNVKYYVNLIAPIYFGQASEDTTAPTLTASPSGGTYTEAQSVTLSASDDTDPSPAIYYTTDGSTPNSYDTRYTGAVTIGETTTLMFIAVDDAGNTSSVGSETYTISSGGGDISGETYTVNLSLPSGATELTLKKIPAGTFTMGSPDSDSDAYSYEKPQHSVTISQDFYMGVYEVTNAQYAAFVQASGYTGSGVDWWSDGDCPITQSGALADATFGSSWDQPMVEVSWDGAQAFISWLNNNGYAPDGYEFVLPTEAQWEYCCRAGTTTIYSFGDDASDLGTYAWYSSNSGSTTHDVGGKQPNAWGLYDMHGNVWEWCRDWYDSDYYSSSPSTDPENTDSGTHRVVRGGGWYDNAWLCRSAIRINVDPGSAGSNNGFRLALDLQ